MPSDAATNETFIELMCEFEPSTVYGHLRSANNYRLQETLEVLCKIFGTLSLAVVCFFYSSVVWCAFMCCSVLFCTVL